MKLYNTLTKQVEEFIPIESNVVRMYTCGPTVYDYAHIGNLRTYIFEDVLQKGLEYLGYDVKRVMNITDVGHLSDDSDTGEDKMLKGAKREGKSVYDIAKFYTNAFLTDIDKLNIKRPKVIAKASDHINIYIKMIEKMLENDFAYIAGGNVYFDVSKSKNYYQLAGHSKDDLLVGVRDDVDLDNAKKNPADFGLWFTLSKFNSQAMKWDSPWGVGYPGWHIECSGIACNYLGEKIDIHCGAVDNIFPHHTNEIAQSEAYLGHKWCNYWCHGEFLNDNSGKMSKSKGGILTLTTLEEKGYSPLVYRYFCLGSHYRKVLVFSYESLDMAKNTYEKLKNKVTKLNSNLELEEDKVKKYQQRFKEAIEDDLNTSTMLTLLYEVLKDKELSDTTKLFIIKDYDKVLSLDLGKKEDKKTSQELLDYILEKIEERNQLKANKDYKQADEIRNELEKKGVILKDTREKTEFEIIK